MKTTIVFHQNTCFPFNFNSSFCTQVTLNVFFCQTLISSILRKMSSSMKTYLNQTKPLKASRILSKNVRELLQNVVCNVLCYLVKPDCQVHKITRLTSPSLQITSCNCLFVYFIFLLFVTLFLIYRFYLLFGPFVCLFIIFIHLFLFVFQFLFFNFI